MSGDGAQVGLDDSAPSRAARSAHSRVHPRNLFALAVLAGLALLLWTVREASGPYVLGLLLAYLLLPVVHLIEDLLPTGGRLGAARRPVAVILTMVLTVVALALVLSFLLEPVMEQTADLLQALPEYWDQLLARYDSFREWYEANVPAETQTWIAEHIQGISEAVIGGTLALIGFFFNLGGSIISSLTALVMVPLFVIYYLIDEPRIPARLRHQLPSSWAEDAVAVYRIGDRVLGTYTRGVVLEAVIVGIITGAGYWLIGVDLYLPLGVIAFAGEVVPILGPWIAFAISFPVVLVTQPELAIPAVVLFGVIQALEGWIIAPKIQGESVDFSASTTLVILAIGAALGGGFGVLVALPVAALARTLIVYVARRLSGVAPAEAAVGLAPGEKRHNVPSDQAPSTLASAP
jgi:predicted PurR-regulated permease PerM